VSFAGTSLCHSLPHTGHPEPHPPKPILTLPTLFTRSDRDERTESSYPQQSLIVSIWTELVPRDRIPTVGLVLECVELLVAVELREGFAAGEFAEAAEVVVILFRSVVVAPVTGGFAEEAGPLLERVAIAFES